MSRRRWKRYQSRSALYPSCILLLLALLVACDQTREAERLMASAVKAKQEGQLEVAAELYHRAAGLTPQVFDAQYQAAVLDLAVEKVNEAEAHLQKAVSLKPDVAVAYLNLGAVLFKKGDVEASGQEFREALRLNPRLTKAYFNLGMMEVADGHFDEAEQLFMQVIALDPTHQTAYVQLGIST
jgi:tetratricopeptide (TPR) repeat protein